MGKPNNYRLSIGICLNRLHYFLSRVLWVLFTVGCWTRKVLGYGLIAGGSGRKDPFLHVFHQLYAACRPPMLVVGSLWLTTTSKGKEVG